MVDGLDEHNTAEYPPDYEFTIHNNAMWSREICKSLIALTREEKATQEMEKIKIKQEKSQHKLDLLPHHVVEGQGRQKSEKLQLRGAF